jgi:hypothetical protein
MKHTLSIILLLVVGLVTALPAEEGMFPLSEIHKLNLRERGFEIEAGELYNPSGVSMVDGIINLGGCTASFISSAGLILTNYHCAFGAIQSLTTIENDYLRDGFYAVDGAGELPAQRYTARLVESYRDVSRQVLSVVSRRMGHGERSKAIEEKIKGMVVAVEKANPGRRAEIAEMFRGKTYVLFVYANIKDVRLVYAPPRAIGEFGGAMDNWSWPRHTGDFAMLRAYVAPDGSFADYSPRNVPYRPKKHFQVSAASVQANDFVFALGYPGSTHRHKSSHYLAYEEEVRLPFTIEIGHWLIALKEKLSASNRDTAIKLSSSLQGLWNSVKRGEGQLKGLRNLKLAERRQQQEAELQKFIAADPARRIKYGSLFAGLDRAYEDMRKRAHRDMTLSYLVSGSVSTLMSNAFRICEASFERAKPDTQREEAFMERNFERTEKQMTMALRDYYEPAEKAALAEMLQRAAALPAKEAIPAVRDLIGADAAGKVLEKFLEKAFAATQLKDPAVVSALLKMPASALRAHQAMEDPFMRLAFALYSDYREMREAGKREKGVLDPLLAQLVDAKKELQGTEFIPDANSTLRLTYGRVRGYSPADAVQMQPFTTVSGIVEKAIANPANDNFNAPQKLLDLAAAKAYGTYAHPALHDVPVAMLYDMDTTGGNSGSPVFNARGELIGLNFDRVYEATINDFAWDPSYSRSIGVDARFILWSLDQFSNAQRLLKEMELR